ncbi:MAG: PHP domain-containing protein [Chloroflexi bacterium]|nr:PHP domain-containing protein [Chloroflexota bacterium]
MTLIDLHSHTKVGGSDSSISPQDLVFEAKKQGLDGICFTEHGPNWDWREFQEFAAQQDILVFHALEVETEMGHIGAFGLHHYVSGMHRIEKLREVVDGIGGYLVAMHPFRRFYDHRGSLLWPDGSKPATLEEASHHPVFRFIDALEALNGGNNDRDNEAAHRVARILGKSRTAGSDAHSHHGVGCHVTVFERNVRTDEDLVTELRAGRFRPATGLRKGNLTFYEPD